MAKLQEGYLTKESGSWIGHYSLWVLDHKTGVKKRKQRAFKIGSAPADGKKVQNGELTETEAKAKLRQRLVEELGMTGDARMTIKGFIDSRWKPLKEGGWRSSTKETNENLLKVITDRFGNTALEDVDSVHLQSWLNSLAKEMSGSVVRHVRIFLKSIFAEAAEQNYLRKSPARTLSLPKLKAVAKPFLGVEQVKALLKAASTSSKDKTLLSFIFVTALRPSEIFALRWKDIDLDKGLMTIKETVYRGELRPFTKTTEEGEIQQLVIPASAVLALTEWHAKTEYKEDDDFVFPNKEGGFITKENYQRRSLEPLRVNAQLHGAEIPVLNFQIIRRTVATHAQDLGSPKSLQGIMRHKKMETAQQHYVQTIDQSVREMSEGIATKFLQADPKNARPRRKGVARGR